MKSRYMLYILLVIMCSLSLLETQAQQPPVDLDAEINKAQIRISEIVEEEGHLRERFERSQSAEERQEIEAQLQRLDDEKRHLEREIARLLKQIKELGEQPPPSRTFWDIIKDPPVLAAIIGAIAVVLAAVIGLLRKR